MEAQAAPVACIQVKFELGSETYFAQANTGGLVSDHLVSIKERSMIILNDFITKHNIPDDGEEQDDDTNNNDNDAAPPVKKKSKKQQ